MNWCIAIMLLEILGTAHGQHAVQCYRCEYPNDDNNSADLPCVRVASSTGKESWTPYGCFILVSVVNFNNGSVMYWVGRGASERKMICELLTEKITSDLNLKFKNTTINVNCETCNSSLCTAGEKQLEKSVPKEIVQAELDLILKETGSTPILLESTPVLLESTPVLLESTPVLLKSTSSDTLLQTKPENTSKKPNKTSKIFCSYSNILVLLFWIFKKE